MRTDANETRASTFTVGIDIGSVSINAVVLDDSGEVIYELPYRRHFGRFVPEVLEVLRSIEERFAPEGLRKLAITGNHGRIIAERIGAPYEFESITQLQGVLHLVPNAATVIAMGGQDAALLRISQRNGRRELESFAMNGPCASGTGSFIDQQAERLASAIYQEDVTFSGEHAEQVLGDFIALGKESTAPAPVACRCTVFTKSDMIHLQNKGETLANIIAGLHLGNAANFVSTLVGNQEVEEPVVFIGGVAGNDLQGEAFRRYFPELIVPPRHASVGALGAALFARQQQERPRPRLAGLETAAGETGEDFPRAAQLILNKTLFTGESRLSPVRSRSGSKIEAYLGVDIGSTTTKTVLMDTDTNILHKQYVQTQGKPIKVTQRLLEGIRQDFGSDFEPLGICTTGSGRYVVGDFLGADLIVDEITAHARAAVHRDPAVDTVFEIGGQDSKYIWIDGGNPLDFDMNKVCAAGTGSFLHELASKLGINIVKEFEETALSSGRPIDLAERCTVFMESDLVSYAQRGAPLEDLIAGLCYAIVRNYLNRVVQKRPIGGRVMFLGGPSLNKGIVAAFENVLGQEIVVPEHREVLGAHGAALSVMRGVAEGGRSADAERPGVAALATAEVTVNEKTCNADPDCHNECKLKIYDFGRRKSVWGGDCGRYEMRHGRRETETNWFSERESLFEEFLDSRCLELADLEGEGNGGIPATIDGRRVMGLPRALHFHQYGVLWTHLLANLDFAVVLSPKTTQQIGMAGIESMTAETCYPVKVFHGHAKTLLGATPQIFLPAVIDMPTPRREETGYLCPMVQSSHYMARAALEIPDDSLVSPTLNLKHPPDRIVAQLYRSLGKRFGLSRRRVDGAFCDAWDKMGAFRRRQVGLGQRFKTSLQPEEPWIAVSGRPYNLYDERLNLHLGRNLAKVEIKAVPQDLLDTDDVDLNDFPRMYWGLGAQILRTARLVADTPGAYGIHLTNFSCGADSFIEHFYRHVMKPRPYLILELDEHSAVAGVVTRLEAFTHVIRNERRKEHRSPLRRGLSVATRAGAAS
jgi:predicted CoA-substrate-specific enzyme activase